MFAVIVNVSDDDIFKFLFDVLVLLFWVDQILFLCVIVKSSTLILKTWFQALHFSSVRISTFFRLACGDNKLLLCLTKEYWLSRCFDHLSTKHCLS